MKLTLLILFLVLKVIYPQELELLDTVGNFDKANSIAVNPAGFIFITDESSNMLYKTDTLGNFIKEVGGYGWSEMSFDTPVDVFATTLDVYVCDKNNSRIQLFDKDLNYLSEFRTDKNENSDYNFAYPISLGISNQGDLFLLDADNSRIIKYDMVGKFSQVIGGNEAGSFALSNPKKMAVSSYGNLFVINDEQIFVFDQFGNGILKLNIEFHPTNINITNEKLILNNDKIIKYLDLMNGNKNFINYSLENSIDDEIVEGLVFNQRLYILTENQIYIFKILPSEYKN
ncbi:MAG: NHL repeat-containing protein [Ignavibacteriales bacterium]|nr:NHL repeat-containing protein [Ignavibacteriales bacterium]